MRRLRPVTTTVDLSTRTASIVVAGRVLRPGGVLILTTPNRRRLANVADGSDRPLSPDHLSELSYDELHEVMRAAGFTVRDSTGLHLELLLNWLSPLPKLDRLQRQWNRAWAIPLMETLFTAGRLFPRYALDLMFVAIADDAGGGRYYRGAKRSPNSLLSVQRTRKPDVTR